MTLPVECLKVRLLTDGADWIRMLGMSSKPDILGLTISATLMRMSFITNYREFATEILYQITE